MLLLTQAIEMCNNDFALWWIINTFVLSDHDVAFCYSKARSRKERDEEKEREEEEQRQREMEEASQKESQRVSVTLC